MLGTIGGAALIFVIVAARTKYPKHHCHYAGCKRCKELRREYWLKVILYTFVVLVLFAVVDRVFG